MSWAIIYKKNLREGIFVISDFMFRWGRTKLLFLLFKDLLTEWKIIHLITLQSLNEIRILMSRPFESKIINYRHCIIFRFWIILEKCWSKVQTTEENLNHNLSNQIDMMLSIASWMNLTYLNGKNENYHHSQRPNKPENFKNRLFSLLLFKRHISELMKVPLEFNCLTSCSAVERRYDGVFFREFSDSNNRITEHKNYKIDKTLYLEYLAYMNRVCHIFHSHFDRNKTENLN